MFIVTGACDGCNTIGLRLVTGPRSVSTGGKFECSTEFNPANNSIIGNILAVLQCVVHSNDGARIRLKSAGEFARRVDHAHAQWIHNGNGHDSGWRLDHETRRVVPAFHTPQSASHRPNPVIRLDERIPVW